MHTMSVSKRVTCAPRRARRESDIFRGVVPSGEGRANRACGCTVPALWRRIPGSSAWWWWVVGGDVSGRVAV